MTVLVTGAAGFIGMHVCEALLARGDRVCGIDNLNDYYDPALKQARLKRLQGRNGFVFEKVDIGEQASLKKALEDVHDIDRIVHLAAQAGVRYSLVNPHAYVQSNVVGHLNILEYARHRAGMKHLVYASSSSVYGGNTKLPFSIEDRVDNPVSLYAATKKSDELISHAYAHLYDIPMTGLRFFTVYGPWGRPDMSAYIFAEKIMAGEPIPVFNNGDMQRDFTYIDDIVAGVIASLDNPPERTEEAAAHRVFNLGNNRPEALLDMIHTLEKALGRKAEIDFKPMQPGDVKATYADIDASRLELGYEPKTSIEVGLQKFADWYKGYSGA
ncbi:SDR family NAD(P)-dependent oxidoreductase [Hwanghaeella grinnelliae]|uniref:SDR family NAD(P)-dependent oxidoreductase n=1 Tax=Hwanghaeella grinnelliae TaxID=2500179 RepID=A0A437QTT5_9PROT|nr:SDR family NAD(P)-dependent oxidoreductase [Hwanghaeella grinnelliae]RVU37903.1 SDR family NAD(P)-dependent oxidoreductase [Hwanghaeella grinnelliae]